MRPPDFVIGDPVAPYLRRWWVIPRNRWFNFYLHQTLEDDQDRPLHDHPWANMSILLRGAYLEQTPRGDFLRRAPSIVTRRAADAHRLIVKDGPVWTLFVTGPVVREWGFYCPKGWKHWRAFVSDRDKGQIGAGCD